MKTKFLFSLRNHTFCILASSVEEAQRTADLSYPQEKPVFIGLAGTL